MLKGFALLNTASTTTNMKLLKISDTDCPVCAALAEVDVAIATDNGLEFECVDLDVFAKTQGEIRDYVISYHVSQDDGMIDLPIYLICDDKYAKASSVIKDEEDLHNLLYSWALYNKSKSSDAKTE